MALPAALDHTEIERIKGRELSAAERHIDVLAIDRLLRESKDELERAIEAEKMRAARQLLRGRLSHMQITPAMTAVLEKLYREGIWHGREELERAGYRVRQERAFALPDPLHPQGERLRSLVGGLDGRVREHAAGLDLSGRSQAAILRSFTRVLGARNAASVLVSPGFMTGLGEVFSDHADQVGGWEYTSVLDDSTCEVCGALDGEQFDTWAEIEEVLPNGGPNPDCYGGERCRCRAAPAPAGGGGQGEPSGPVPVESIASTDLVPFDQVLDVQVPAQIRAEVQPAVEAVGRLLEVDIPTARVVADANMPHETRAMFNRRTRQITVNPASVQSDSVAHEIGHLIDMAVLGPSRATYATHDPRYRGLTAWRQAVRSSSAYSDLRQASRASNPLSSYVNYLMLEHELFARSFAQWVALRSGDARLYDRLDSEIGQQMLTRQWEWDDFDAIARALDDLFESEGILASNP